MPPSSLKKSIYTLALLYYWELNFSLLARIMEKHQLQFTSAVTLVLLQAQAILLLALAMAYGAEGTIGVNYGTIANNLPPPRQVAKFLLDSTVINRVRLFDADPVMLEAFAHTGIAITATIPNDEIPRLTNLSFAEQWIKDNILPWIGSTNIIRILVGNEVLSTGSKIIIGNLVPAMQALHTALVKESLDHRIQVSTPHSLAILSTSTPPSTGKFRQGYDTYVLKPLLSFLRATDSPFMVNPYPFFGCSTDTLDFALFRPNPGVFDENTGLNYTNMLDAQLDAVFSGMKRLGYGDVDVVIAETGWPSAGDTGRAGVDPESAATYNARLMQHIVSGIGTPLMPNRTFETYIFALFNEDMKPGPVSERHFGLFEPDLRPVYDIGVLRPTGANVPFRNPAAPEYPKISRKLWCLPRMGAKDEDLQRNIDYVCGLGLDCRPIQAAGRCFLPNTVRAHAAYAMNLYYQATGGHDYNCNFRQTGAITDTDPSYGGCKY
ncbi:hypothetical protein Dimus_000115 [Dionaea muscipula]